MGYTEEESRAVLKDFMEKHGTLECKQLLTSVKERGENKKAFCDGLVLDMVAQDWRS